ncbi:putative serine/threonine-protein kinase [Acanthamoeba polyphaga mimivirus]|uniref:Serine/threonine-protein kinase n=1 Tax=Acanthamoeba polyphaga mimivirus Kroon TaxID=3069720 RepID=A0A0G2Y3P8_9VIRU|nr:putative serine/threonine-protein kinase [Acanthamoeba polyphaga mimivirus]AKI80418.1 putative serine/threonine-protein kinase [Acanthamoeba polyphaga mimivirus Kroon]
MSTLIDNHIEHLSKLSNKKICRILRIKPSNDIDKNDLITKLILDHYYGKPRLGNIIVIKSLQNGGVRDWEFNLEAIDSNNRQLDSTIPWNNDYSLMEIQNTLNHRYNNINQDLVDLLSVDDMNNSLNTDFLKKFYTYFYIGNYNRDKLCQTMKIFAKSTKKVASNGITKNKTVGKGAAGIAFLAETNSGSFEFVIKAMNNVKQYRNKSLDIGTILYKSELPLRSNIKNNHLEYLATDVMRTVELRYPGYSGYNAFISNEGLLYLNSANDNFTNQTIMHIVLNRILTQYDNDHFIYQFDAFFCENRSGLKRGTSTLTNKITLGKTNSTNVKQTDGYNIMEFADAGSLDAILDDWSKSIDIDSNYETLLFMFNDIFVQILKTLKILQQPKFAFVHGDLKTKNIFVKKDGQINLPNGQVFPRYVYKIADYDKSSITWNGIRFHNSGNLGTNIIGKLYDNLNTLDLSSTVDSNYYYLTNICPFIESCTSIINGIELESIPIRYLPIPFYSSIDVYSFVTSMLCHKIFHHFVDYCLVRSIDNEIINILKHLFTETDLNIVMDYINNTFNSNKKLDLTKYGKIIAIIKNNHIGLRKNINKIYDIYGIKLHIKETRTIVPNIILSANQNICLDKCKLNTCNIIQSTRYNRFTDQCYWKSINSETQELHISDSDQIDREIDSDEQKQIIENLFNDIKQQSKNNQIQ